MKTKTDGGLLVILCSITVLGGYYFFFSAQHKLQIEKLLNEVESYHAIEEQRVATVALWDISQPFLVAERRGRYDQRLDSLDRDGPLRSHDSYGTVLMELASELHSQFSPEDYAPPQGRRSVLRVAYDKILELSGFLEELEAISKKLTSSPPKSMAELKDVGEKFEQLRLRMEAALEQYE